MASFGRSLKTPFFWKSATGRRRQIFLKLPKKEPWPRPTALWCKCHYPLISIHLYCKDRRRFWRRTRLQKCPNGRVMANFGRSPQSRIFWKSAKGELKEIFQISPKKMSSFKRPKSTLAQWQCPLISMHLKCKHWRRFRHNQRLKKGPSGEVIAIFGKSFKTCLFRKSAKGRPKEVFQKSPKK